MAGVLLFARVSLRCGGICSAAMVRRSELDASEVERQDAPDRVLPRRLALVPGEGLRPVASVQARTLRA